MNETTAFIEYERKTKILTISSFVVMAISLLATILFGILGLTLGEEGTFPPLYFGMIGGAVIYFAVGLPLNFAARKRRSVVVRYNALSKVLMRNPHNSVAEISEALGIEPRKVVSDFDELNKLGFFERLSIDTDNLKVDLYTGEKETFVCPNCGGTNEIELGSEQECAFCGAINEKGNDAKESK